MLEWVAFLRPCRSAISSVPIPICFYHGAATNSDGLLKTEGWRVIGVRFATDLESIGQERGATLTR
jgi:hypothetical protein